VIFKDVTMNRRVVNRRAFLRGAGAVAVGLPFLESMPSRSAWAAGAAPVFTFFVVAQNGVVAKKFFPGTAGTLTTAGLSGAGDLATSVLAPHAANLLFLKGLNYPAGVQGCGHAEGCVQTLTGLRPGSTGNGAYSSGPSADTLIGKAVGKDPIALYSGAKGYIAERISFKGAGAGQVRAADVNPYILYSKVVGLAGSGTTTPTTPTTTPTTPTTTPTTPTTGVAQELANRRKSVNDLVRVELQSLMGNSVMSAADKRRLEQHFQAIRDIEVKMDDMATQTPTVGAKCSKEGLPADKYEAFKSGFAFKGAQMEEYVKLHLQIMAVAFGCNYNQVATLQWGDGTDGTMYDVPSNKSYGWSFHQLSHRMKSDSQSGNDPTAEAAHAEIDKLRMQSLLVGLDAFKAHGLENNTQLIWTNTIADGPSHSSRGVPMIIWGNAGGYLKQGIFVDTGGAANAKILNTIIAAATGGSGTPIDSSGEFAGMKA
jgi:hypothetical protein